VPPSVRFVSAAPGCRQLQTLRIKSSGFTSWVRIPPGTCFWVRTHFSSQLPQELHPAPYLLLESQCLRPGYAHADEPLIFGGCGFERQLRPDRDRLRQPRKGRCAGGLLCKRVSVIERAEHTGGSCINTGTVPARRCGIRALFFRRSNAPYRSIISQGNLTSTISCTTSVKSSNGAQRILKKSCPPPHRARARQAAFLTPHTVLCRLLRACVS